MAFALLCFKHAFSEGLKVVLCLLFVCASSQDSGETAHLHRLAFVAGICPSF